MSTMTHDVRGEVQTDAQAGLAELALILTPEAQILIGDWATVNIDPGTRVELNVSYVSNMEKMRKIRRALGGGAWNKEYTEYSYKETRDFSDNLRVILQASRSNVCKRVEVGTQKVEKIDPAVQAQIDALRANAPMVEVEEPVYEWDCVD